MGFYGNITNTSNTTFSFDRIYPNRLSMDANANNDGIFIGRYVLVEYDNKATISNIFIDTTNVVKTQQENGVNVNYYYGYTTETFNDINTRIQYKPNNRGENKNLNVYFLGEFGQVQKTEGNQLQQEYYTEFYQCVDSIVSEQDSTISYALFKYVTKSNTTDSEYIKNFAIDEAQYKEKKGYDSTVWTKASVKKPSGLLVTEYVRIADLNSVVPTFDLETDAPTMKPLVPHFDADSTNVYYKLHTQPQWGLRVAEVESGKISDSKTNWISSTYNPETGQLIPSEDNGEHDAAIYFNKAAFLPQVDINRKTTDGINKKKEDSQEKNYFTINPTGTSGNQYYLHTTLDQNGNLQKVYGPAVDIQEMEINLPAIGNMMSDAWDIIHGPLRNDDMRQYLTNEEGKMLDKDGNITEDESKAVKVDSLQGRLNSIAVIEKNQIPIKRIDNGQLVGTKINGDKHSTIADNFDASVIENDFTQDDAWIKTQVNADNTPNAISIHHTFNKTDSSVTVWDKNGDPEWNNWTTEDIPAYKEDVIESMVNRNKEQDDLMFYVPYVDKTGHVVGHNIERVRLPFGYKTIKVNNTLDTVVSNAAQGVKSQGQIADNTQDTLILSASNRWIKLDNNTEDTIKFGHQVNPIKEKDKDLTDLNDGTNTITIQDTIYDEAGHVTANQKHTYTLPYGFKYINVANDGKEEIVAPAFTAGTQTADNTQDTLKLTTSNKWILLDGSSEDAVQFGHLLKTVPTTTSTQSLSDEISQAVTFKVYDDSFDEAGHHNGRDTKTITMPFGYGKIKGDNGNTAATATYDELNVVSGDDWINTEVSQDTVTVTHTGPVVTTVETKNNIENPSFGSTFVIEDWHFDNKGHMHTPGKTHTVQFPKGNIIHPTAYSSNAEIITNLAFNPESGVISYQKDNSGTLKLTSNYTNEGINSGSISGGDSLNTAFAKLEKQVMKEANARVTDILKEVSDRNLAISSAISAIVDKDDDNTINKLAEVIEWINNNPSTATQMQKAIQDNTKAISDEAILARSEEGKIAAALATETGRATAAEQANVIAIGNEKTRAENIEQELQEQIDTLQAWKETATEDIANLNGTISQLLETINDLTTRIENLENPPQVPDESGETV